MNVCVRSSHVFSLLTRQPKRFHPAAPRRASDDPLKVGGWGRGRGDADSFTGFGWVWSGCFIEAMAVLLGGQADSDRHAGLQLASKKTFIILQLLTV